MAGRPRRDPTADRLAEQCEIAHHIEDLVAHELVREAQLSVDDTVLPDEDAVVESSPGGEPSRGELREFMYEAERAGRCDLVAE